MYLDTKTKEEIFQKYSFARESKDTGSPEAQVALFTFRIAHLTEHLKKNKKDVSTRMGLMRLVGKRRSLLAYLAKKDIIRYRSIIKELGIRK